MSVIRLNEQCPISVSAETHIKGGVSDLGHTLIKSNIRTVNELKLSLLSRVHEEITDILGLKELYGWEEGMVYCVSLSVLVILTNWFVLYVHEGR